MLLCELCSGRRRPDFEQRLSRALQYAFALIAAVAGSIWYDDALDNGRPQEDLSIFLICIYFVGVIAAVKFFHVVSACLTRFGIKSEDSIRQRARIFMYAREEGLYSYGECLDLVVTLFSIISCGMYITETYMPYLIGDASWQVLDLCISLAFLLDYMLRLWLATDTIDYAFSVFGVINLVTVLPVLVFSADIIASGRGLGLAVGSKVKLSYLRLLRLAKLLRILRSVNIVRTTSAETLRRAVISMAFSVSCLIFTAAGVYQWLENDERCFNVEFKNTWDIDDYEEPSHFAPRGCVYFHQALYYCTIEVLGRPRLQMKDHWTVLMVILLVSISVILIPRHIASVFAALQQSNVYQRNFYKRDSEEPRHIVVTGHKDFVSLNMLLYELFHSDRGDHQVDHIVLLFSEQPEHELVNLMGHPAYLGRVTYVQGTPMLEKDLCRAAVGGAVGVIILADKDSSRPQWHDSEIVSAIQAMKSFWMRDVVHTHRSQHFASAESAKQFLRPRIVAQVLLPETRDYVAELPYWIEDDVVVVCSEYVAWMVAMASVSQGMATVVFNLTSHTEKQRFYQTRWYPRYESGATQEIYSLKVEDRGGLVGESMCSAAHLLGKHQVILIGFERHKVLSAGGNEVSGLHLFPGPSGLMFIPGDTLFCIATSLPALHKVSDDIMTSMRSSVTTLKTHKTAGQETWNFVKHNFQRLRSPSLEEMERNKSKYLTVAGAQAALSKKHLPRGCEDTGRHTRTLSSMSFMSIESSADIDTQRSQHSTLLKSLRRREPKWSGHFVLCGLPQTQVGRAGGRGLVTELIETLLQVGRIGPQPLVSTKICIIDNDAETRLADLCLLEPDLAEAALKGFLRAVSAERRNRNVLSNVVNISAALSVIALPDVLCTIQNKAMEKQILDTSTVLTMQVAGGASEKSNVTHPENRGLLRRQPMRGVTLLLQESTTNLFMGHDTMRHRGSAASDQRWMDIAPLNMSPLFAHGALLAMTCCDRFTVEAFFTPQVIHLVRLFLLGDPNNNHLYQMTCPSEYIGCTYGELMETLIEEGQIPVGIFRSPDMSGSTIDSAEVTTMLSTSLPDASLSYVITNPAPDSVVLRKSDLIFAIGDRSRSDLVSRIDTQTSFLQTDDDLPGIGEGEVNGQTTVLL